MIENLYEWRIEFCDYISIPTFISGVKTMSNNESTLVPIINHEILTIDLQNSIITTMDGETFKLKGHGKKIMSAVMPTPNDLHQSILATERLLSIANLPPQSNE